MVAPFQSIVIITLCIIYIIIYIIVVFEAELIEETDLHDLMS